MSIHDEIKTARLHKKWSMERLAAEVSKAEKLAKPLSWQTVQQWESGASAPKRKRMETVASLLGLSVNQFVSTPGGDIPQPLSLGEPDPGDELEIPALTSGVFGPYDRQVVCRLALSEDWVAKHIDPLTSSRNLRFTHAYGDSMEPTVGHGDVLLVDAGILDCEADGIYVLQAKKRLYIRRVRVRMNGSYEVSSDNSVDRTVEVFDARRMRVLGRAVWVWGGRKL
jgi:phage repressor protein C with HTH and peptisase S24 domain